MLQNKTNGIDLVHIYLLWLLVSAVLNGLTGYGLLLPSHIIHMLLIFALTIKLLTIIAKKPQARTKALSLYGILVFLPMLIVYLLQITFLIPVYIPYFVLARLY